MATVVPSSALRSSTVVSPAWSLWHVVVTLVMWLCLIEWPLPGGTGLDPSWQYMLADAWHGGRHFGGEFVFTYGPWGFLLAHFLPPAALDIKLAFELIGKLLLAAIFVDFSRRLTPPARWFFLAAVFFAAPVFVDPVLMLLIGIIAFAWMLPESSPAWRVWLGGAVLGFLALTKFSLGVLAGISVAAIVVIALLAGRAGRAAAITAAAVSATAAWWLAAGQRLADIPGFMRLSSEVSSGYSGAMGLDESWAMFWVGVTLVTLQALWLLWFAWRATHKLPALITAGCLGVGVMMAWKLGFVRADGHVVGFFAYSLLIVSASPGIAPSLGSRLVAASVAVLAVAGLWLAGGTGVLRLPIERPREIAASARSMIGLREFRAQFVRASEQFRATQQLPAVRAAVGTQSIDFLGDDQAQIFYNDLRYHPRPMPQSYATYTPALLQANLEFLQSERRPAFILMALQPIDGRLGAENDSLQMTELGRRYEPVLVERGYLLLARRPDQPPAAPIARTPLTDRVVSLGERITLAREQHAIFVEIDARPTIAGRLRSLLYKPAPLTLSTVDLLGEARNYRLVADIARAGFIVTPELTNTSDVQALIEQRPMRTIESFTVSTTPEGARFWQSVHVRVSRLDNVPANAPDRLGMLAAVGLTNLPPESVASEVDWRLVPTVPPQLLLHARGEITFRPPPDRRRLSGVFGILEGAYAQGETDGVEFTVTVSRGGGREEVVFKQHLQPRTQPSDGGAHQLAIDLPKDPDLRVIIRTGPGPAGDGQWDWSYLGALTFTP